MLLVSLNPSSRNFRLATAEKNVHLKLYLVEMDSKLGSFLITQNNKWNKFFTDENSYDTIDAYYGHHDYAGPTIKTGFLPGW